MKIESLKSQIQILQTQPVESMNLEAGEGGEL